MPDETTGIELTPEQKAFYLQAPAVEETPKDAGIDLTPEQQSYYRKQTGQLDPLQDFDADQLAALQAQDPNFSVAREYANRPDLIGRPDIVSKAVDAHAKVLARNEIPTEGMPATAALGARVVGAGKTVLEASQNLHPIDAVSSAVSGLAGYFRNLFIKKHPFSTAPDTEEEKAQLERGAAEDLAASEAAVTNLASGVGTAIHKAAQVAGVSKPYSEYTQSEKTDKFFSDLTKIAQQERIAAGHGPITTAVGGREIAALENQGLPVRPEEVAKLEAGDPFSFYGYGKLFGAAGGFVPPAVRAGLNKATAWTGEVAKDVTGTALEGIGGAAKKIASVTEKAAPALGIATGLAAGHGFGFHGLLSALIEGGIGKTYASKSIAGLARLAERGAGTLEDLGRQVTTGQIKLPAAQLITDVAQVAPNAALQIALGAGFDIGTAAAIGETPQELQGPGIGLAFGLLGAGRTAGGRVLSGQLIAPRAWGSKGAIPSSRAFPAFDAIHNEAYKNAPPGVQQRLNAVREFMRRASPGVDIFYTPDRARLQEALVQAGVPAADAANYAQQEGLATNINGRKVVFVTNPDAAPHEAFHPFQDVLGREANDKLNETVRAAYTTDEFDALAKRYAARLGWDGSGTWKDFINAATNEGHAAAVEKMTREVATVSRATLGIDPTREQVNSDVARMWREAIDQAQAANPGADRTDIERNAWRGLLTPEEQSAVAERYAANELSAEVWDAVFKHTGKSVADPKGLIAKFSRVAGNLVHMLGGEPLEGRVSEIGQVPLRFGATEAIKSLVQEKVPAGAAETPVAPRKPFTRTGPTVPPVTPAQKQEAADKAKIIADEADEVVPVNAPAGAQSQKEILGTVAENIASGTPVRYKYYGADGDISSADPDVKRETRRQDIERSRNLPDDLRQLFDRIGIPYGVTRTKTGVQVLDWSPELLASNAVRWAKALSELPANDPALAKVPFELDRASGEFTEQGWRQLFDAAEKFSRNQLSGFTGVGGELVVPRELSREGLFPPPQTGTAESLPQPQADFINLLYSLRPPKTPRAGKTMPRNISAQIISEATQPGRVVEPSLAEFKKHHGPTELRVREPFAPEVAARYGVETISETNPLRAELEKALQANGTPLPDTIEVVRRLNADRIHSVEPEPAQPPTVGGNVLTLQAGFQPRPENPRAVKEAAVRDEDGNIFTGRMHWEAEDRAREGGSGSFDEDGNFLGEDGFVSNSGEFLTRNEAFDRAVELKQISEQEYPIYEREDRGKLEAIDFNEARNFQPMPANARAVRSAAVKDEHGKIFEGTWHGDAFMKAQSAPGERGALEEGFVANNGDWYTREKAAQVAQEIGQLPKQVDTELESGNFERSRAFQPKPMTVEEAQREDMPMLDKNQFMLTVVGPDGTRYPARFDGWQENIPGKPPMAQITPKVQFPFQGDAVRSTTYDKSLEAKGYTVEGLPERPTEGETSFQPKRLQEVQDLADKYAEEKGFSYTPPEGTVKYPRETAKKLAAFYDKAVHSPDDPEVKKSYDAFKQETLDQFKQIQDAGYTLEPITSVESPYRNGADVARDVEQNKHLFFNLSESAFGTEGQSENQLMLEPTGIMLGGKNMLFNDIFRAVHDFFGHAKESFSFGPRGEFNAWREHAALYSPEAQGALAAETIGQTAWTQVKPSLLNAKGELLRPGDPGFVPRAQRPYAEQKNFVMPAELIDEAKQVSFQAKKRKEDPFKLKKSSTGFSKAWILPSGQVQQLGGEWHHEFLNRSPELLEKYGIPSTDSSESNRQDALAKGFARVNWEDRGGRLTIEARAKDWRKIKGPAQDIIERNLDDIDNVSVYLYNDDVTQVVDQGHSKLFQYDDDYEKTQHLPFITEGEVGARKTLAFQAKREDFENPETLKTALTQPGWAIITATREAVGPWDHPDNIAANEKLSRELKAKGYEVIPAKGNYKGVPQGTDFLVLGIDPDKAQELGKRYGQESVLTNEGLRYSNGEITPGNPAETLIGEAAKEQPFFSTLPNGTAFSIPLDFEASKIPAAPVGELPDLFGGKAVLSTKATAEMSNAALKEHFPEAVVPNRVKSKSGELIDPKIDSDILGSPLYKQAGSEEKAVKAFADKLADFLREGEDSRVAQLGRRWYEDFFPALKKEFGEDAQIMAELLAASSPNEKPDQNFAYAVDALEGFKSGRFDKIIAKFNEGWDLMESDKWVSWYAKENKAGKIPNPPTTPTPEAFMAHWIYKHDLKPKQSSGALYGFHGRAILEVMARKWLQENAGPKTANFVQNLLGTGEAATIDLWAIRTMRRLGYEGFQDRWRILPKNQAGVNDADFAFSQKVFKAAADQLGIKAREAQGQGWYQEKNLWAQNGWSKLDLGSYMKEMEKLPLLRKGIQQRLATTKQRAKIKPTEELEFELEPRPKK